jgi:hypothetical protein
MFVQRLEDLSDRTAAEGEPVLDTFAEVQQRWHLWRRRYNLFIRQGPKRILSLVSDPQPEPETESYHQIARIDEPFLAWYFTLRDGNGKEMASVSRAFRGFGREVCTEALRLVQVLIYADFHRYRYGTPQFGRDVGLRDRRLGRYTIRFSSVVFLRRITGYPLDILKAPFFRVLCHERHALGPSDDRRPESTAL